MNLNSNAKARACAIFLVAVCCLVVLTNVGVAQVFPNPTIPQTSESSTNRQNGIKRAVYYVIYDETKPFTDTQWADRVNSIRNNEIQTRQFFAANSGGKIDIYYQDVVAVPLPLNGDGTRPSNWLDLVDDYVAEEYSLQRNNFFTRIYDLNLTKSDPNQGWGGLYTGNGRDIYLQSNSLRVTNHEIAHRLAMDHAKLIEPVNNSNFTPYVWNPLSSQYETYYPSTSSNAAPFGSALWQYGNPYDVLGGGTGHIRVQEKLSESQGTWLTNNQVPQLGEEGVYRIYAHDELQAITNEEGTYGVAQGYHPDLTYGLRYQRPGQRFDQNSSGNWQWINETQQLFIEYRAGTDGVGIYLSRSSNDDLDGALLDLDPRTGNSQRLLRVGSSIEDPDMGMSRFFVPAGSVGQDTPTIDFLSFNPPPPTMRAGEWFHFTPLSTGVDSYGSYIDLKVSLVSPLNGIAGDLDQNGEVDEVDLQLFIDGWRTDTSMLSSVERYYHGDLNFDGITDLYDAGLFRAALIGAGLHGATLDSLAAVPEPATYGLLLGAMAMAGVYHHRRARANRV